MSSPATDIIEKTDAAEGTGVSFALWLERGVTVCLFVLAAAAPHSIAATQIAWGVALALWVARLLVRPRPALDRTPVDYWLLGFFILTFFSALLSYEPDVSIGKLRAASLFTVVYVVAQNVRSRRVLRLLVLTLVASCAVNVVYTFGATALGRGVKVTALAPESPLRAAGVLEGDTLLKADGEPIGTPDDLARALAAKPDGDAPPLRLHIYRVEWRPVFEVPRGTLLEGRTGAERLGIRGWSRGRDERATGFYGHYTTYAEVLQLVASLALGLLVARGRRRGWPWVLLALAVAGMVGALILTVTRASWLGFLLSAFVIAAAGAGRRTLLVAAGVALPLALAGLFVLQQKRQVGFIDTAEGSTRWRLIVYREGLEMLVKNPRHLLVGVGMDSIKRRWREWGMFDGGRQPVGHLHSTPLQLAFERGLPALMVWLGLLCVYARTLWRLARSPAVNHWVERGLALGALGGLVGFFAGGVVHYNLGDSEVAQVFYLLMGLALAAERFARVRLDNAGAVV